MSFESDGVFLSILLIAIPNTHPIENTDENLLLAAIGNILLMLHTIMDK